MTFSFNASLTTPTSRIRQFVGDTIDAGHLVEDETISAYYTAFGSELRAAAQIAYDLSARFARSSEITVDHQTSRLDQISKSYAELGDRLLKDAAGAGAPPGDANLSGIIVTYVPDAWGPYASCNPGEPPPWER